VPVTLDRSGVGVWWGGDGLRLFCDVASCRYHSASLLELRTVQGDGGGGENDAELVGTELDAACACQ